MGKKGVAKGIDPRIEGEKNDREGLVWIDAFGWMRRTELGRLIWPNSEYAKKYTSRLVEKWLKKSYVMERDLPDHNGKAIVLSQTGANFLENNSIPAKSGKDIGEFYTKTSKKKIIKDDVKVMPLGQDENRTLAVSERVWVPSAHWKHELLATGFLTLQYEKGDRNIIPERQIRRENPKVDKIPDGIIKLNDGRVFFVEIENTKKEGLDMKRLINSVIHINAGEMRALSGHKPDGIIVSYVKNATDLRGFKIDHKERLIKSIKKVTEIDVDVYFAEMELSGIAPVSYTIQKETVLNDEVSITQNAIDSTGWKTVGDIQISNWNDSTLRVSNKNAAWEIVYHDGRQIIKGKEKNISLAKRAVAEKMTELLNGPQFNFDDDDILANL